MIEEENDEDVLEKSTSWKKVLKHIAVVALLILGVLFIYGGIGPDQVSNFFIGFMLICFATTLLQVQKEPEEPYKQTLSILNCQKCDMKKVRHYEDRDYVYKIIEDCDECEGKMQITQIYSVKLKKPTIPGKKKEKKLTIKNP
ncbi:MAG: hypothetical protein GF317_23510 [Candidatus Lokiarchaeota archaeon]|nr:hypothetical protein [Candidatus Lokiarchaeota archaeon]MBD3202341.1 hypothetical protein [Candidatus Lokiarchaeota archaeon]